jgi:hypothetical protein
MAFSIFSRTMQKAAELLGGRKKLSRHLQVPEKDLQNWIDDKARPPTGVFLRAVDVILEETPPPAGAGPEDPPSERNCAAGSRSSETWY